MNVLEKTAIAGAIACVMLQKPAKIIVSFSDRRLSHVTAGEQAISYSIAFPRAQSRW